MVREFRSSAFRSRTSPPSMTGDEGMRGMLRWCEACYESMQGPARLFSFP